MHRGTLQPRDGRLVSDQPNGMTVDVLGKPPRPYLLVPALAEMVPPDAALSAALRRHRSARPVLPCTSRSARMRRKPDDASPIRPRIRVGSPPLATSHRDTRRSCEEWPCRPTRAGGCEDRRRASAARLWDRDGKPLATLQGHTDWVTSAAFAPDGGRILTASDDRTARLWDPDGKPLAILQGHTFWVTSAVFAPDGGRILTASDDSAADVLRTFDRSQRQVQGHTFWVTSAVFAPDGGRILI
jgi:hypothetical protein